MSNKRDNAGRFRSKDGSQPTSTRFDLQSEAQRLYQMAQTRGDFTGAASVLRLMRDLRPDAGAAPVQDRWVTWLNADELNSLSAALDETDRLERIAKARRELGGDPPDAHVIGAGTGQEFWRDTPETSEERQARYDQSKSSAAPTVEAARAPEPSFVLEDDEIEIELEEGELLPGEES